MVIQSKCRNAVDGQRSVPHGLAPLALLLVSLAGGNVFAQTGRQVADVKPDNKVIELRPVRFEDKDRLAPCKTPDGKLEVVYMDLGSDVGLVFRSSYNIVLHANFNRNHAPTNGDDRNYGVDFGDNKVCSWPQGTDASRCEKARGLRGAAKRIEDHWEVSLRIPKRELSRAAQDGQPVNSWVTFETFDVSGSEASTIYPPAKPRQEIPRSKLFELVYRLDFDQSPNVALHPCWPPAPPRFSANSDAVWEGERICLAWDVPNASGVTITDFGEQNATGHGCIDAGPLGLSPVVARTFTLRTTDAECVVDKSLTVSVKSLEIRRDIERGDIECSHGDEHAAVDWYRRALTLDPKNADAKAKLDHAECGGTPVR
jgi:hypothetical protein